MLSMMNKQRMGGAGQQQRQRLQQPQHHNIPVCGGHLLMTATDFINLCVYANLQP